MGLENPGNVRPGDKFNRLTAIRFIGDINSPRKLWLWLCDCGKEHQALAAAVKQGGTTSCGCKQKEGNVKHGLRNTPEYNAWVAMRSRCNNPNSPPYPDYGGRGIQVCAEWNNDVVAFVNHVGPRPTPQHSIERKDNDGNYEPGNVHWATKTEQSTNRRSSLFVEHKGQFVTISELGRRVGTTSDHVKKALLKGYTVDEIVAIRQNQGIFKSKGISLKPEDVFLTAKDIPCGK